MRAPPSAQKSQAQTEGVCRGRAGPCFSGESPELCALQPLHTVTLLTLCVGICGGPVSLKLKVSVRSFKTIISYIDEQFERYLHDESGLNRRHIVDNRVHCCFYFISPFGHGWAWVWAHCRVWGGWAPVSSLCSRIGRVRASSPVRTG